MGRRGCCFAFLIVLLLPLGLVDMAQSPYWYCDPVNKYAPNTTFDHNLRSAFASLVANVSSTIFSNVTVGRFPDQVIATVQCRGDLDDEVCAFCVSDATVEVTQRCPNSRFALFLVEDCLLYYRDRPLPPQLAVVPFPTDGSLPNPQRFKPLLISFFNNLILSATTNPSGRLFWGDKFYYTKDITIYGTAQCVQSLEMHDCISCLDMAYSQMLQGVDAAQGGAVFYRAVCLVRYETYPFFTPSSHKIDPASLNFISSNCSLPTSSDIVATLFERNLNVLLTRIIEAGAVSGFYSDTVGSGSDQVYGQFLCRGDVPVDLCWNCSAQASAKIQELCPNSRSAVIWLDYCQLRYSDENFAGIVDDHTTCQHAGVVNASNPASFDQNLRILINNLISLATQSSPGRFFATGISALPDSTRIYALVQCVRDVPTDRCRWCLQNASSDIDRCSDGKQTARIYRGSCILAFGGDPFFFGNATLPPVLPPTHVNDQRRLLRIITTISAAGGALIILIFLLVIHRIRKNYLASLRYNQDIALLYMRSPSNDESEREIPQICLKVLQDATADFSDANKLGQGGYGHVYKGKLPNGQLIAVKRLSETSAQGLNEFKNEANLIAKLQHKNLVRLLGCCMQKGEKLLIYEYMPNKSLDGFLKDPEKRSSLNWETRFNIITGVARGILYLHQDSRLNVIHRDLKAANVLLDGQMNPKISDFGMARIFIGNQSQANTVTIAGTYGYMAPEYAMDGLFSIKSDVFSFGVLLLEIIGGELNRGFYLPEKVNGLVGYAWSLWSSGQSLEFIDPSLGESVHSEDILKCIHIALLCVQDDPSSRPTMSAVFSMLVSESRPLQKPAEPTFCVRKTMTDPTTCCFLTQSELTPR